MTKSHLNSIDALMALDRPVLLYRQTCWKCRLLSRVALGLSLGGVKLIPLESKLADDLYDRVPESRGKAVLIYRDQVNYGIGMCLWFPLVSFHYWIREAQDRFP